MISTLDRRPLGRPAILSTPVVKAEPLLLNASPRSVPNDPDSAHASGWQKPHLKSQGERAKGDEIRNQVGEQCGRAGRKLCNLYLKSYVSDMFQHYLEPILQSARDRSEIRAKLNELIRSLVRFSEYVFFIHQASKVNVIAATVKIAVKRGVPYIALHGAGARNVRKIYKIVDEVGLSSLEENGYDIGQQPTSTPSVSFLDVIMTKSRPPRPSGEADEPPA